ncbi:hypothetical protein PCANC_13157 [Puccinia coronata f. sp. avenae]|uniref:Uncharacterized protein n=1 Tax=Puccinia coronata f. sp. avenae TaxID=200324 RepID=A0A2N5UV97_9BASI|nr:hypothetical protein PCANC_13157 [Puccinia coronata f. sp. avenae]
MGISRPSAEKKSKARVYCRFLDGTTPAITHPRSVGETGTESSARTTRATSIPASIQIGVPNNSGLSRVPIHPLLFPNHLSPAETIWPTGTYHESQNSESSVPGISPQGTS